jgi:hypothetical protein
LERPYGCETTPYATEKLMFCNSRPPVFSDPQGMKLGAPSIAFFAMGGKAQILQALFVLLNLPFCFLLRHDFKACPEPAEGCPNRNQIIAGFRAYP